jgi:hypothetical protein
MEIFKTIKSFTDYEVSNFGRVRTKSRKVRYVHSVTKNEHFRLTECRFLKVHHNKRTGYKFCQLYRDKKMYNLTIHSLVAGTFLNRESTLDVVNHKDGNKHNNVIENLEWCSNEYNHKHATQTGLKAKGINVSSSKLNDNCVYAIRYFLKKGVSKTELSKAFNISRATIILISQNKIWKHILFTEEELTIKNQE